jgi:hypothetical protein
MQILSRVLLIVWLGLLFFGGTVVLLLASARIGDHNASTYGQAYATFQDSWGGEIAVPPPTFTLERHYQGYETDPVLKERFEVDKVEELPLVPEDIGLTTDLHYGEQRQGWLGFKAFEVHDRDTYTVRNTTEFTGLLKLDVPRPEGAALVYDYSVLLDGAPVSQPTIGAYFPLVATFAPDAVATVVLTWSTKGMDVYRYQLSKYAGHVLPHLHGDLQLDTSRFSLYRTGLPHTREDGAGSHVVFDIEDFSSAQDLGVTFQEERAALDTIQSAIQAAPGALFAFLLVVFAWSQLRRVRFPAFHYVFVAAVHVFFFLFLTFLVRYLDEPAAVGVAELATLAMFAACFPPIFGRRFTLTIALPYLLALTGGYTILFLVPALRGLWLTMFAFAGCLSVMIPVARSDVGKWPAVTGWE